jgi:MraZ protein
MPLLVGKHVNKIDRKGRVSVPKPFRAGLSAAETEQSFAGVYAFPVFKSRAIEVCGESFMSRLAESVDELDLFSDEQDDMASVILESAHALPFDPEGRVVLPPELVEHAGLSGEAMFVGRGARFQVWDPEAYREHSKKAFERARARGATLSLKPNGGGKAGGGERE